MFGFFKKKTAANIAQHHPDSMQVQMHNRIKKFISEIYDDNNLNYEDKVFMILRKVYKFEKEIIPDEYKTPFNDEIDLCVVDNVLPEMAVILLRNKGFSSEDEEKWGFLRRVCGHGGKRLFDLASEPVPMNSPDQFETVQKMVDLLSTMPQGDDPSWVAQTLIKQWEDTKASVR